MSRTAGWRRPTEARGGDGSPGGAASIDEVVAFGEGQVVDATPDGGQHWYRAFLGDDVVAVVGGPGGELVAFAQVMAGTVGTKALTWVYVSKDVGRHWHYSNELI